MKVALFIPCYVDAFFPEVGIATLELLERLGIEVAYPLDQTCCGQPMANSGCHDDAAGAEKLFVKNFTGFDYIVGPSGSCVHHVREHFIGIPQTPAVKAVRERTFELVEFCTTSSRSRFPWALFQHASGCTTAVPHCALREPARRRSLSRISKPMSLLSAVKGTNYHAG